MRRHLIYISLIFSMFIIGNPTLRASFDLPPHIAEVLEITEKSDTFELQQQSIDKSVQNAISTGNSQALSAFFFSTIELTIPEAQGSYSKAQAELLMKNFFNKYPATSFTIINEGQSGGEKSRFAIGTYTSTKGNSFRVYYLIKDISGKNQLTILKFE